MGSLRQTGAGALGIGVLAVAGTGCRGEMSMLDPAGFRAARTAELWWLMLGLGLVVYVAVMAALGMSLLSRPGGRLVLRESHRTWLVVGGGLLAPAVVLLVLIAADLRTLVAVAAPSRQADLALEVVGHQWWWEVRYPDQQIATANEIHIPSGQTVVLHLTSVDVIHSFWVPRLAGKTDLNPGQTNTTWLEATGPGEYRGQCAEYCGLQHANMAFMVYADPPEQFQTWVSEQQQPAVAPSDPLGARGAQAFAALGCITCHAVRYGGTAAVGGGLGPDLTHLASRRTIATGLAPNMPETLERWIADPSALKKGTTMPATNTDPETLRAIAAYLSGLK